MGKTTRPGTDLINENTNPSVQFILNQSMTGKQTINSTAEEIFRNENLNPKTATNLRRKVLKDVVEKENNVPINPKVVMAAVAATEITRTQSTSWRSVKEEHNHYTNMDELIPP